MARRMPQMRVKVEGMNELTRKLRKLTDAATSERTLKDAAHEGAELIRDRAAQLAPVGTEPLKGRTKRLKDGLRVRRASRTGFFGEKGGVWVQVAPLLEVSHANLQELGTTHHPAQPFLRPAFDQKKAEVVRIVRKRLKTAVDKAAR